MTNDQLENYYGNLLIMQYVGKPNAFALIKLIASVAILNQLPLFVQAAYDVTSAVGVQLDVIGKYCGVTRSGYGTNGFVSLSDSDFRLLIQLAIIKNNSGSSLATIQQELAAYFGSQIQISDSANMSLNYSIVNTFGSSALRDLIVYEGLLPKPMGVGISVTIIPPGINYFFCFATYAAPAPVNTSPFNDYVFYHSTYQWITY